MATHISQSINEKGRTVLRVTGEMTLDDALLLERVALSLTHDTGARILVDLADLDFIDSESAPVIRRLSANKTVRLEGMEIFLQSVIDEVEKR